MVGVRCSSSAPGCGSTSQLPVSIPAVSWPVCNREEIVKNISTCGVAPLLYWLLRNSPAAEGTFSDVFLALKTAYLSTAITNANTYRYLGHLLDAFSDRGIRAIVLKGAALAELVYPKRELRPMSDVDILLNETDLELAESVMRDLRYTPNEAKGSRQWYRSFHHHLVPYISRDSSVAIELHQHIVPRSMWSRIPVADLWTRARPAQLASRHALVLSPEDQLLHVSIHASSCNYYRSALRSLYDVAFVLRGYAQELDWNELGRRARRYGIGRDVYYVLWAAKSFVGADVPVGALTSLRDTFPKRTVEDHTLRWIIRRAIFNDTRAMPRWIADTILSELLSDASAAVKLYRATSLIGKGTARWLGRRATRVMLDCCPSVATSSASMRQRP